MSKNIAQMAALLKEWHLSCQYITEKLSVPKTIVHEIIRKDMSKHNIVVAKNLLCVKLCVLLYCMNGPIEGRNVDWKNCSVCKSDFIARSAIIGVFLIDASTLYRPIHAMKWKAHNLTHRRFFCDNNDKLYTGEYFNSAHIHVMCMFLYDH